MEELKSFQSWYETYLQEGGAQRRRIRDAFIRQTIPPIAPASVNSGLSGPPAAVVVAMKVKTDEDIRQEEKAKKKTPRKRASKKKKEEKD